MHVRTASPSTHNLCFEAKIRKIGRPLHTPVLLYKSGVQRGIHYTDMFSLCIYLGGYILKHILGVMTSELWIEVP